MYGFVVLLDIPNMFISILIVKLRNQQYPSGGKRYQNQCDFQYEMLFFPAESRDL